MAGDTNQNTVTEMSGLISAWLLDGSGGGHEIDWPDVVGHQLQPGQWMWLHMDLAEQSTQDWMRTSSCIPELTVESLLQAETRPRCMTDSEGMLLFLRGINLNAGADPEDMVSVRLWVSERRVISLRRRRLIFVDDIMKTINGNAGPETPGDFVVMLVDRLHEHAGMIIEDLYDQVDALEESILVESTYLQRDKLADIRRQAISLRRFLAPQREALNRMVVEKTALLSDENRLYLREDHDRLTRFVEDLDAARERAGVIHESLLSHIAEHTGQRMYLLSITAAIFLPLSFITGLLGINVGGIPGADNELGFPVVMLLVLVVAIGLWAFFRRHRWF